MKERMSSNNIPTHIPTEQEKARGREYLVCLSAALAAKAMTSAGEYEMGENLYQATRRKVQRAGFNGDIFDAVVDLRMRLDKERREHGKK